MRRWVEVRSRACDRAAPQVYGLRFDRKLLKDEYIRNLRPATRARRPAHYDTSRRRGKEMLGITDPIEVRSLQVCC